MLKEKSYSELLHDPRWQKKRLEVLEAADWKCQDCGTSTEELCIHHTFYRRNWLPWAYRPDVLRCLCRFCHEERSQIEAWCFTSLARGLNRLTPHQLCEFQKELAKTYG